MFFVILLTFAFFGSTANAEPWRKLNVTCATADTPFYDVAIPSLTTVYAVGGRGGFGGRPGVVCKSIDAGDNWTETVLPTPAGLGAVPPLYGIDCLNNTTCYAVGEGCNIFKTTNGADWSYVPAAMRPVGCTDDLEEVKVVPGTEGNTAVAVGNSGRVLRTTTGIAWISPLIPSGLVGSVRFQSVHFSSGSSGWIVGEQETIIKTINGGASWTSTIVPADLSGGATNVFGFGSHLWVNGLIDIIRSDDSGTSWNPHAYIAPGTDPSGGPPMGNIWFVDSHFIDSSTGWAVGMDLLKSTDGGNSWIDDDETTVLDAEGNLFLPPSLKGIEFRSDHLGFIVGENQTILRRSTPIPTVRPVDNTITIYPNLVPAAPWSDTCSNQSEAIYSIIAGVRNAGQAGVSQFPFFVRFETLGADGNPIPGASRDYPISAFNADADHTTAMIDFFEGGTLSPGDLYQIFNPNGASQIRLRMTVDSTNIVREAENPSGEWENDNVVERTINDCGPPVARQENAPQPAPPPRRTLNDNEKNKKKKVEIKKVKEKKKTN